MTTTTPAGWYPVDGDQERYWDGGAWANETRPVAAQSVSALSEHPGDSVPNESRNAKADAAASKAYAKASRPWYKKKRWWLATAVVVMIVAAAAGSGGDASTDAPPAADDTSNSEPKTSEEPGAAKEDPPAEEEPEMTASQENAVGAAESYLDFAPFSKKGLIRQLSSDAGDGYPKADAEFAVSHIEVDWNEQAVKAAENYLDFTSFSRDGLIQQLSSDAGDGYTRAQAVYAVNKVGL